MEFFRIKHDIPFMSYGKITTAISLITFLLAIVFLLLRGLNLSMEFTGGTALQVHYPHAAPLQDIRHRLAAFGTNLSVQQINSVHEVQIKLPSNTKASSTQSVEHCMALLKQGNTGVTLASSSTIQPQVGSELALQGIYVILAVCVGIMLYLALRFEWRFALSAIIANMHDIVIILGCFAYFQWEFSLTVLAGVLAVLGYSVNESVVVFDRIRENFKRPSMRKRPVAEIIDNAITATISRTIITHGSTEAMVLSMLIFGGSVLHGFALALTIGIVFGIYSSVLVASPIVMALGLSHHNLIKPPKIKQEAVV
ncbi:MAG: protein translocase subunit SecF [Neisseriales bacterium]|nr:MAG: protein translocase subunit SecF [Neisseriales bacterium]